MSTQPTAPPLLPKTLSAVEAIGPAFNEMQRILFKPFRWAVWWRVGMLAMVVNLVSSGVNLRSGPNPSDFENAMKQVRGQSGGADPAEAFKALHDAMQNVDAAAVATLITVLVSGVVLLVLVHVYVGSVLRFVLFEGACNGDFKLLSGWNKWHGRGLRYYWYELLAMVVSFSAAWVLLILPLLALLRSHGVTLQTATVPAVLEVFKDNFAAVLALLLTAVPALLCLALLRFLVNQIAISFVVPVMALEGSGFFTSFARAWSAFGGNLGSLVLYMFMSFLLRVVASIVLVVVSIVLLIATAIPAVVMFLIVIAVFSAGGHPGIGLIFGIMGVFFLAAVLFLTLVALCMPPFVMFFQMYMIEFFRCRYQPLQDLLYPPPPAPPAPSAADMPLDMTPGNAPAM